MRTRRIAMALLLVTFCVGVVYGMFQSVQPKAPALAEYAPPGALLAIESRDFASLLRQWRESPEQKRWLGSDNYAGFSRSRLFGRLAEAQEQFAATADLRPDVAFLQDVAGSESLFAWYDIGNLQFLYITRLPSGQAEKTALFKLRGKFEERRVGDATFYVRTQQDTDRTVAFSARGDYLLLATREDLIARALDLMQNPTDRALRNEAWYAGSGTAAARTPGDLRMTLNMTRIVTSPYFRSYWIQQNITDLKQYTAAISDFYREKNTFREERTMLPAQADELPAPADLSSVLGYVPADTGIYRAVAHPSLELVLGQLDEKLLVRTAAAYRDRRTAPESDLATPIAGTVSDLEQFIDEPSTTLHPRSVALESLAALITRAQPSAMLSYSSAAAAPGEATDQIFTPIHAAIVLDTPQTLTEPDLQHALTAALDTNVSIARHGLAWTPQRVGQDSWSELDGIYGLTLAIKNTTCVIATDRETLLKLLQASKAGTHSPRIATIVAGFSLASERAPFLHITSLLDGTGKPAVSESGKAPPFFSGNVASVSNTFQDVISEDFVETAANRTVNQTVVYRWR